MLFPYLCSSCLDQDGYLTGVEGHEFPEPVE